MNLVLTISVGDAYQKMAEITHPSIKKYAEKIGADFLNLSEKKIAQTTPHWEKFQIFDLLSKYNRILYLDTDLIVREDCPNLFDEVDESKLGMFNEAPFTDRSKELLIDVCRQYNVKLDSWNGKYFNSGVMVISKRHKNLFRKPQKEVFNFYEQSYLNMMIAKQDIYMHELDYKFNRMTCMDRVTGEERHGSYIIHYAGYPNLDFVLDLIPRDLKKWESDRQGGYEYCRHIYVSVSGGLGDQIAAEPAVRFMREKLYPEDDFIVATHHLDVYRHLEKLGVKVCEHGRANLQMDTPYFLTQTLPGPDTVNWAIVSHLLSHTVDYSSIAIMKRTLPVLDRTIKFELTEEHYSDLYSHINKSDLKNGIVVHPGKHWNSKTFPVEYWQGIIDGLVEHKQNVIIIGKDERGDPPDYKAGARGTVDVECPRGVRDLRNMLSLGALGALLNETKVLVSNDSAPIHLAGAFDNWIVLLPSCKHPDHIIPYRHGRIYYKAKAIYKALYIDDVEGRPTQVTETSADGQDIDWDKYLAKPEEIISKILSIDYKTKI